MNNQERANNNVVTLTLTERELVALSDVLRRVQVAKEAGGWDKLTASGLASILAGIMQTANDAFDTGLEKINNAKDAAFDAIDATALDAT